MYGNYSQAVFYFLVWSSIVTLLSFHTEPRLSGSVSDSRPRTGQRDHSQPPLPRRCNPAAIEDRTSSLVVTNEIHGNRAESGLGGSVPAQLLPRSGCSLRPLPLPSPHTNHETTRGHFPLSGQCGRGSSQTKAAEGSAGSTGSECRGHQEDTGAA